MVQPLTTAFSLQALATVLTLATAIPYPQAIESVADDPTDGTVGAVGWAAAEVIAGRVSSSISCQVKGANTFNASDRTVLLAG